MKINEKIKRLNEIGLDVEVIHHRLKDERFHTVLPQGGITTVYLIPQEDDDPPVKGEAHCSVRDNYNKRLGVQIALGRAIHNYFKDRYIIEEVLNDKPTNSTKS